MTKREKWDDMIKKIEINQATKEQILKFLKEEAPKPKESRKKLPCTCGCKTITTWWYSGKGNLHYSCQCGNCGKEAEGARYEIQAIRNWNNMIKREVNGSSDEQIREV